MKLTWCVYVFLGCAYSQSQHFRAKFTPCTKSGQKRTEMHSLPDATQPKKICNSVIMKV